MEHFPPVYPFQEDKWFQLCKRLAQRAGFSCDDPESLETVLFRLYADMLGDTVRRLNQTPEKHRRLFFNQVPLPRLPARAGPGIADRGRLWKACANTRRHIINSPKPESGRKTGFVPGAEIFFCLPHENRGYHLGRCFPG